MKIIYSYGTDIVAQKINEIGKITETLLVEVKQTDEIDLGTLGRDRAGNLGGTIAWSLRTMDRLANTTKEKLSLEFWAIPKDSRQVIYEMHFTPVLIKFH